MFQVLIADDEYIIRQGLRCILDWESLGFHIKGETSSGVDTLDYILCEKPDLVLLDIRMPKMLGIDVVKSAREKGFTGKIIILSGFTDFQYAQAAIHYGVDFYLTKPIDENELLEKIQIIASQLKQDQARIEEMDKYMDKAKSMILYDIMTNQVDFSTVRNLEVCPKADSYQVVIYEKYSHNQERSEYRFSDLLKVTNDDNSSYDNIHIDHNEVLLLKGDFIQKKFQDFLERYERDQKPQMNSPLDSLFISYGHRVTSLEEIHLSYQEALRLLQRRFFCDNHQHTIGYQDLPKENLETVFEINQESLEYYCNQLVGFIQISKRNQVAELLHELETNLFNATEPIERIKLFLTDLYLSIKGRIAHLYHNQDIPFPGNSEIIRFIDSKYYLYEIILYFTEQFEMIMKAIGNPSSDSVMDDIIHYIEHNYMDNIKLENIAPLFGYNSSYLGKIFNKKVGVGFNVFIDKVRVSHSKELLTSTDLKVYEIAEKVGYRNVDYFHTKFKKYVDQSPAEYRKQNKILNSD